jgi:secretion/DNA translocation related TadE-like protein
VTEDRGSATVLILALLVALLLAGTAIGVLAQAQVAAVRAQTAADAAVLAAAPETFMGGSPLAMARQYAAANGTELVTCTCPVDRTWQIRRITVTVQVPLDVWLLGAVVISRSATAEFEPVALLR